MAEELMPSVTLQFGKPQPRGAAVTAKCAAGTLPDPPKLSLNTIAVHGGATHAEHDRGSAVAPIYQSTTFAQSPEEVASNSFRYTRLNNNPNQLVRAAS